MKRSFYLFFIIAFLFSCSTSKHRHYRTKTVSGFGGVTRSSDAKDENPSEKKNSRMMIYNAVLKLKVKNTDTVNALLTNVAEQYGGYVLSLGSTKSIIRVKSDKLNNAIQQIAASGKLKHKTISGEDVTEQYQDFSIRLDNAKKARQRYLELLAKAENVEAALKVEKELERLNGEIDSLEGKIKRLQHLTDFSTITIYLEEKIKLGILGYFGVGIYKAGKWLFVRD